MTAILISDTHFTDKPRDEYRWGLWPWLREQIKLTQADELIHLGDLTDAKDRHPSKLVNRLIQSIGQVSDLCRAYILKGNHDYIDPLNPFFEFIGNNPKLEYIKSPSCTELSIGKATFIPAGEKWNFDLHDFPYCFTHVTFDGAEAENGSLLPGVDPARLKDYAGMCYSGDIHVPQKIRRNIEYVGAPYHIRFGDSFTPRVLVVYNNSKTNELHYPSPRKRTLDIDKIEQAEDARIKEGDHVRIRYYLRRADYDTWRDTRNQLAQLADARGWEVFAIEAIPLEVKKRTGDDTSQEYLTSEQLFTQYANKHMLSDEYISIGKSLFMG